MDVPLPDVPCVRIRIIQNKGVQIENGNRFYFSYSGSAPSAANLNTLASDVASLWNTNLAPLTPDYCALEEVDCLDIATDSGFSGFWTGSNAGTRTAPHIPGQVALGVEFNIARRYRGGKPRAYFVMGVAADMADAKSWGSSLLTPAATDIPAFFNGIAALSIGSMGTLKHVNLSYYKGYTNIENPGERARTKPTYRATALHDDVTGYAVKTLMSSQKRRRTSTTP